MGLPIGIFTACSPPYYFQQAAERRQRQILHSFTLNEPTKGLLRTPAYKLSRLVGLCLKRMPSVDA